MTTHWLEKNNLYKADLNKAITYLIHIGLLDRVVKKAIVDKPLDLFHDSYYFYMKTGSERALTYRKIPTSLVVAEEDLPF